MRLAKLLFGAVTLLAMGGTAVGGEHYAAPNGTATGDGSMEHPWNLDTALGSPSGTQPSSVKPGDTIWLRGGIYVPATDNGFISHVTGAPGAPIKVRNYNGERATLQARTNAYVLAVYGADTWYWGLEGATTGVSRTANQAGSFNNPLAYGFAIYGPSIKVINCIVHDTAQGFSAYNSSPNSEFYGNLSYYNGWMASDRNHGHGMYLQNITGTKLVEDNFVGDNADEGIQAYGSGAATITGITIQGNTLYNTSSWPTPHYQYNLVMGGGQKNSGNTITENMSYFTPSEDYGFFNIGQYTPGSNLVATNNVFVGGYIAVAVEGVAGPFVFTGNKIYNRPSSLREVTLGQYSDQTLSGYTWDNNTYYGLNRFFRGTYDGNNTGNGSNLDMAGWRANTGFDLHSSLTPTAPTGIWIYVRPNKYEAKRANITIYNWDLLGSVNVDLSNVLAVGDQFVIRDSQNFYGPSVASGTYAGVPVSIPMAGLSKAAPVGFSAPAHTGPLFGTFIVMPPGAGTPISQPGSNPTPTPTPTPPATSTKFTVGSVVMVVLNLGSNLNVRANPDSTLNAIGTEKPGSLGTVVAGPAQATGMTFWQVQFVDGITGWVVESYIVASSAVLPLPASVPKNSSALVSKANWKLVHADSQETECESGAAANAFDGNVATIWHTQYCSGAVQFPHEIQIDMGTAYIIKGFHYLPRQDGGRNGRIGQYEFYATNDLSNWGSPLATGSFTNDATEKQVLFAPNVYRYVRLRALTEANGGAWASMAEFSVLQAPPDVQPPPTSLRAVSKTNWKPVYVDSQETQCESGAATNGIDASAETIWHTQYCGGVAQFPHEIQIDIGTGISVGGFRYLPRQDGGANGRIGQYEFYATNDLSNWGAPLAGGTFANDSSEKQVLFTTNTYRYVRLRALTEANGGPWASMAELTLLQSSAAGQ